MLAVPLPFVVALMLGVLGMRMAQGSDGSPHSRAALAFVAACALLAVATGLRWEYGWKPLLMIRPMLAAALPPLAWITFAIPRRRAPHLLPFLALATLATTRSLALDFVLAAEYFLYGAALLWLARGLPESLQRVAVANLEGARRAIRFAGVSLVASSFIDLAVALDYALYAGTHAVSIVGGANVLVLILVALAAAFSDRVRPAAATPEEPGPAAPVISEDDAAIAAAIERLLGETGLYRDPELTLERLARRSGIPARRISAALNRVHGRNVSQVINGLRIAEARRLLVETDHPVTTIQFECGFLTKSNFNREFLRITGASPSEFRRNLSAGRRPGSG